VKIGDLVRYCNDGRLGLVVSEVFEQRPKWEDEHPAVHVLTSHSHTGEEGTWTWLLKEIEVVSES
jgi:hypothetical protein